jgi:DNA-binding FadR family transcriptional regulator
VARTVAREIARDIAERGLDPGTPLGSESDMLRRYGVSRPSLREALRILEVQGLLSIKPGPGGGPTVNRVTSADYGRMSSLFFQALGFRFSTVVEARLLLEPLMATLAARHHDPADAADLRAIVYWGWQTQTNDEWLRASDAFHGKILSMSGNPLLTLVASAVKDNFTSRYSGLNAFDEAHRERVKGEHQAVADAIIARDEEQATRLMEHHMGGYAGAVEKRYPSILDEIVAWR